MSIIQTIRDKGSWVIVTALVLALISFIFMDAGKQNSLFGGNGNNPTIGTVNGTSIKKQDFSMLSNAIYSAVGKNGMSRDALDGQVWQLMVSNELMASEFKALDCGFDDKTLEAYALGKYGNPNQIVVQLFESKYPKQFTNEQGQFNTLGAENFLKQIRSAAQKGNNDLQSFLVEFEALLPFVKTQYAQTRYNLIMTSTTYVPNWMAENRATNANKYTNISYVQIPYTDVNDSTIAEVKLTDNDIKDYVSTYPQYFTIEDSRNIDYTTFDYAPTVADTMALVNNLLSKKEKLVASNDTTIFDFMANNLTETQYTGSLVRKRELQLKDSTVSLIKGGILEPFINNNMVSIAKVMDVKNYADSASVQHILIKTYDQQKGKVREDDVARKLVDSIVQLYKAGQNYDSLAAKFNEDEGSKGNYGKYEISFSTNFIPEFLDYAFTHASGATDTLKTVYGYHFIKAGGTKGAVKPAYKVAFLSKTIEPSAATKDSVNNIAVDFATKHNTGKAFDEYFTKGGTQVKMNGYDITRDNMMVRGLNDDTKDISKWAFQANENAVSSPFELNKAYKYVVAKLVSKQSQGTATVAMIRTNPKYMQYINELSINKKYSYLAKKYTKVATIDEAATKTLKQVIVKDSISYQQGVIPGAGTEGRVVGAAFNPNNLNKPSGLIKGTIGAYYVQANTAPYTDASKVDDVKKLQKDMETGFNNYFQQFLQSGLKSFKIGATIKDKRIEKDL